MQTKILIAGLAGFLLLQGSVAYGYANASDSLTRPSGGVAREVDPITTGTVGNNRDADMSCVRLTGLASADSMDSDDRMKTYVRNCSGNKTAEGEICVLTKEVLLNKGGEYATYGRMMTCPTPRRPRS